MINHKFSPENAFQKFLYRIDNWINEVSGWIVELIETQYINISNYRPLSGSSYVKLPAELRSPKKRLINVKKKNQKLFYGVMLGILVKIHPVKWWNDEKLVNDLDYNKIELPVREKDFSKIETKSSICINVFCYENRLVFPIYVLVQRFKSSMDLLHVIDQNKSHYVYIKYCNRFMFHKVKNKKKKLLQELFAML